MKTYKYRARNMASRIIEGTIQADDINHAHGLLEKEGLLPVEIRPAIAPRTSGFFGGKIGDEDLIMFTRQFAALLDAGMPVLQCLDVMRQQAEQAPLKKALDQAGKTIQGGGKISEAFAMFPKIFPAEYVNIIVSGESGGDLVESLESIAEWLERETEFKREIKTATRYPIAVVIALIIAVAIVVVFVIPKIALFLRIGNVPLPLPTRILLAISDAVEHHWLMILACIAVVAAAFVILLKIPATRFVIDRWKFSMPMIGPLYSKIVISRFGRVFSMLIRNGVTVLKALDIAPGVVANKYFLESLKHVKQTIQGGSSIAEGFAHLSVLPPMVAALIAIGEKTGSLDGMLNLVVKQYNAEIRFRLRNLNSTIEPVITVILGVAVLFLALAILLPVWDMMQVVKR